MATLEQRLVKGLGRLWTIQDVAAWARIHPRTVGKWTATGRLPEPIRARNFVRWDPRSLFRWKSKLRKYPTAEMSN